MRPWSQACLYVSNEKTYADGICNPGARPAVQTNVTYAGPHSCNSPKVSLLKDALQYSLVNLTTVLFTAGGVCNPGS